jgi:hypothetical protein
MVYFNHEVKLAWNIVSLSRDGKVRTAAMMYNDLYSLYGEAASGLHPVRRVITKLVKKNLLKKVNNKGTMINENKNVIFLADICEAVGIEVDLEDTVGFSPFRLVLNHFRKELDNVHIKNDKKK